MGRCHLDHYHATLAYRVSSEVVEQERNRCPSTLMEP
jgi:hypothetical protein